LQCGRLWVLTWPLVNNFGFHCFSLGIALQITI
jgi:hypothetical protein